MTQDTHGRHPEHHRVDEDLDELSPPPSNKKLLCTAFISFQGFAIFQLVAALYAGSEAMLGDSIAMMIDALAYLFNMVAERQKEIYASKLKEQNTDSSTITPSKRTTMVLKYRKYTYQLELVPPLISVVTLLVLTILVFKEAIHTLILDAQRDASLQADPDVNLMAIFSAINLVLDIVNVGCFASANHAFGYKTSAEEHNHDDVDTGNAASAEAIEGSSHSEKGQNSNVDNNTDGYKDYDNGSEETGTDEAFENESLDKETNGELHEVGNEDDTTNLNMCSAYTHVFADTIRSISVILAALLAKFTDLVTPEVADASAAVVVSVLIFLTLIPLISGMIQTFKSLKHVNRLLKAKGNDGNSDEDQVELLRFA